jgi:hypothetical protein
MATPKSARIRADRPGTQRRTDHEFPKDMDGRIVGVTAATVTLIVLWFVALGLFTSLPGVLLAGLMAAIAGSGVGAVADPSRSGHTAAVVIGYIAILLVGYMLIGQTAARYAPPESAWRA